MSRGSKEKIRGLMEKLKAKSGRLKDDGEVECRMTRVEGQQGDAWKSLKAEMRARKAKGGSCDLI